MADTPKNIAASVRQRLLNLARAEEQAFDVVLVAFGLERLIYRLSISAHRDRFVLKGGMLVTLWTKDRGRFTRDVDFLSFGAEDEEALKAAIAEILVVDAEDGLIFDDANLTAAPIRDDHVYGGMRLKTNVFLEKTRIPITIDVGFGDALGDPDYTLDYGSLLDFPSGSVRAYSPETRARFTSLGNGPSKDLCQSMHSTARCRSWSRSRLRPGSTRGRGRRSRGL